MRSNWKTIAFVAVAAIGGVLAGRALAEEDMGGMPQAQQTIDAHPLMKAMSGKWNVKTTGDFGDSEGVATFRVGVGKTALLEEYDSKGAMGDFNGYGWFKLSDDGKTGTLWWLDNHSTKPSEFKGTVSDTGYEFTGGEGPQKMTMKFVKKGEGFEWSMSGAMGTMTGVYTKAK